MMTAPPPRAAATEPDAGPGRPPGPDPWPGRPGGLARALRAVEAAALWLGRATAWLVVGIVLVVVAAVVAGLLKLSVVADWGADLPLLGDRLTPAGLVELQWHLFGVLVMIGASYALLEDRHVRVDFIHQALSARGRRLVDVVGHLALLLPFCAVLFWLSLSFVERAYVSGEGSTYDGLVDRYLIKAIIPVGFALLFLTALVQVVGHLLGLFRHDPGDAALHADDPGRRAGHAPD